MINTHIAVINFVTRGVLKPLGRLSGTGSEIDYSLGLKWSCEGTNLKNGNPDGTVLDFVIYGS